MAPQISPGATAALRAVSFYIASANPADLPHVVVNVSQSLRKAKEILQSASVKQSDGEAGVVLHRFNTQVASFLQGRTANERFAAIVLIKAATESGGYEVLSKAKHWVTALLTNLKKGDPSSVRLLAVTTLTRIFLLTWDYPTLVREITTPALPVFVSTCLTNLSRNATFGEIQTVFESFASLVVHHPTIFRGPTKDILRALEPYGTAEAEVQGPGATKAYPHALQESAQRLSVLLHYCEPKQGSSSAWEKTVHGIIASSHGSLDRVLVNIDEDWQPTGLPVSDKAGARKSYDSLDRTKAILRSHQHIRDLLDGLGLLRSYLVSSTASTVIVPIGSISNLLIRLFSSVSAPDSSRNSLRFRDGVSQEERDTLISSITRIHVLGLHLTNTLIERYGNLLSPICQTLVDQISWIFQVESADPEIRTAVYVVLGNILPLTGPTMTKDAIKQLKPVMQACCGDVMPETKTPFADTEIKELVLSTNHSNKTNSDSLGQATTSQTSLSGLREAATILLSVLLSCLPSQHVPETRRAQMDRTAVLTRHKDAMIASVMNPTTKQKASRGAASLLPFLSREFAGDAEVESLLRPRMPLIKTNQEVRNGAMRGDEGSEDDMTDTEQERTIVDQTTMHGGGRSTAISSSGPPPQQISEDLSNQQRSETHGLESDLADIEPPTESKKRPVESGSELSEFKRLRSSPLGGPALANATYMEAEPSIATAIDSSPAASGRQPEPNVQSTSSASLVVEHSKPAVISAPLPTIMQNLEAADDDSGDDAENFVVPLDLLGSSDEEEDVE